MKLNHQERFYSDFNRCVFVMVDTSLLLAISQASATFVAILAGFYTTKIISISSEKKKLHSKIREIDNELTWRRRTVASLAREIDNIHNKWDEEAVESFAQYLVTQPYYNNTINTFEDIKQRFEEYYEQPPSENRLKILERKCPSILEEIQKNVQDKTVKLLAIAPQSEHFRRALQDNNEVKNRDTLRDQLNREESRISFLEDSKTTQENDLKFLVYPKYVKFGYASFIIFAMIGVIFPLTYRWWPLYWRNNSELLSLSAFGIGLLLTFLYLGLELRNAFSNDNKPSRIRRFFSYISGSRNSS
jgi:predicted RND superfamily exporter protein